MSAGESLMTLGRIGGGLIVVLALVLISAKLARRARGQNGTSGLHVVDRIALSREAHLAVVDAGAGRRLLLGVTPQGVSMLTTLGDDASTVDAVAAALTAGAAVPAAGISAEATGRSDLAGPNGMSGASAQQLAARSSAAEQILAAAQAAQLRAGQADRDGWQAEDDTEQDSIAARLELAHEAERITDPRTASALAESAQVHAQAVEAARSFEAAQVAAAQTEPAAAHASQAAPAQIADDDAAGAGTQEWDASSGSSSSFAAVLASAMPEAMAAAAAAPAWGTAPDDGTPDAAEPLAETGEASRRSGRRARHSQQVETPAEPAAIPAPRRGRGRRSAGPVNEPEAEQLAAQVARTVPARADQAATAQPVVHPVLQKARPASPPMTPPIPGNGPEVQPMTAFEPAPGFERAAVIAHPAAAPPAGQPVSATQAVPAPRPSQVTKASRLAPAGVDLSSHPDLASALRAAGRTVGTAAPGQGWSAVPSTAPATSTAPAASMMPVSAAAQPIVPSPRGLGRVRLGRRSRAEPAVASAPATDPDPAARAAQLAQAVQLAQAAQAAQLAHAAQAEHPAQAGQAGQAGQAPVPAQRTQASGSVLSPNTWKQGIEALRELTVRRG